MAETYRFQPDDAFGDYGVPKLVTRVEHDNDPLEIVRGIAIKTEHIYEEEEEELLDPEYSETPLGVLHITVENDLDELGFLRWNDVNSVSDPLFIRAMDFLDRLDQQVEFEIAPIYAPLLIRGGEWGDFRNELWSQAFFRTVSAAAEGLLRQRGWGYMLDEQPTTRPQKVTLTLDVIVEPEDLREAYDGHPDKQTFNAALDVLYEAPAFDTKEDILEALEFAGTQRR